MLEEDLKQDPSCSKIASKIIFSNGKYIKTYCKGFLNSEGEFSIRLSGICEDNNLEIL